MEFGLSVLDVSPVSSGSDGAGALRNTLELARLTTNEYVPRRLGVAASLTSRQGVAHIA